MKRLLKPLLCCFLLFCTTIVWAQERDEFSELAAKGMKEIDDGNYDDAIATLKQARELTETKKELIDYEIAFAKYLDKDYKTAIKMLKELVDKDVSNFQFLQMLGNAYDMDGNSKLALKTYEQGMERFPDRGEFYLEKGVALFGQEKFEEAIKTFEQGVAQAPNYPSNYYHLSNMFFHTEEEIWGLLYGEIFMNLERNTKRTAEISKNIYNLYKKAIVIETDTTRGLSFTKREIVVDANNLENFDMEAITPFENKYELSFVGAAFVSKDYTLSELVSARESFFDVWNDKKNPPQNALIAYQNKIRKAGHFEAYSYWILMQGQPEEYDTWFNENESKHKAFVNWFMENGLEISKDEQFHRLHYK